MTCCMSKKAPILQLIVGEDADEGDEGKSYLAITPYDRVVAIDRCDEPK